MRQRVSVTETTDVSIILTDDSSTDDASISSTDNDRMYVCSQTVACMCICPSYVFNFSQQTPVVLPYWRDQTLKNHSLPFPGCAFPVWAFTGPGSFAGITRII